MRVRERPVSLLSKLRRTFSGRPNVIQTREGALRLPAKSVHPHWIVGRALCMYRCEDLSGVPRGKRRAALDLKLPVWSPFERTGYHSVWSGGAAMVWFWDEDDGRPPRGARPAARARRAGAPRTASSRRRCSIRGRRTECTSRPAARAASFSSGEGACSRTPSGFSSPRTSASSAGSSTARRAPRPRRRPTSPAADVTGARTRARAVARLAHRRRVARSQRADPGRGRAPRPLPRRGLAGGEVLEDPPPRGRGGGGVHPASGRARPPARSAERVRGPAPGEPRPPGAARGTEPGPAHEPRRPGPPQRGGRVPGVALPAGRAPPHRDRPRAGPHRLRPRPRGGAALRRGQGRARPRRRPARDHPEDPG